MTTTFTVGAVGGGGFSSGIIQSSDGLTLMSRTDVVGAWIFNFATGKWRQLLRPDNVPLAHRELGPNNGNGLGCWEMAAADSDSSRIYLIIPTNAYTAELWRSDNRGASFTTMQTNINVDAGYERLNGPKMAVDPNNKDVVYWSNQVGIWFRSLDGGVTIHDSGPIVGLLSALQSANTTAATSTTTLTFAATPSRMTAFNTANLNQSRCCYNYTRPTSKGQGPGIPFCTAANGTTVTMQAVPEAQIQSGDTIYFGAGGIIQFDPDGGTTTFAGATVTKNIYFGWVFGAAAIWKSTNGGSTFSSMAGSPVGAVRMDCRDGVLYVCGHTPTGVGTVEPQNMWRYVGATAPAGSGLSTDTWTNLSPAGAPANHFCSVSADPTTPGKVSIALASGNLITSSNWGTSFHQTQNWGTSRRGGDVLWLTNTPEQSFSLADIRYDVNDGRLWGANGIGMWKTTPPLTDIRAVWEAKTLDINSLIYDRIIKVPNGGPVVVSAQDRALLVMPNDTTPPINNGPADAVATCAITNDVLTVTTILNGGTFIPNVVSGALTTRDDPQVIPSNTSISSQLTGPAGGTGTYQLSSTSESLSGLSVSSRTMYYINGAIRHSFDCTFAVQDPSVVFGNMGDGLYKSTDIANEIWVKSPGWSGGIYPTIAAQTAQSFIGFPLNQSGIPSERSVPKYTTDGGATASNCSFGSEFAPGTQWNGWGGQNNRARNVVADRVNQNVYYCYNIAINGVIGASINNGGTGYAAGDIILLDAGSANGGRVHFTQMQVTTVGGGGTITAASIYVMGSYNHGTTLPATMTQFVALASDGVTPSAGTGAIFNIDDENVPGGLYRSTDGGATWVKRSGLLFNGTINGGVSNTLAAFKGLEGHLIRSDGQTGFDNTRLMRRVESAAAGAGQWYEVQGDIQEVHVVALGAPKPGRSVSSVFAIGKFNGDTIVGVYRCDDMTADPAAETTWTLLTNFPGETLDKITSMAADEDEWGTVYFSFDTTGYYVGRVEGEGNSYAGGAKAITNKTGRARGRKWR